MSIQNKEDLRPLQRAVRDAENDEAAEQADAVSPESDRRIEAAMRAKYGVPISPAPKLPIRWAAGGALAAAAAAAIYFAVPRQPAEVALPDYSLEMSGDNAVLGSTPPPNIPYAAVKADSTLRIAFRPQSAVAAKLVPRILIGREGSYVIWPVVSVISPQGMLKFEGPLRSLSIPPPGRSRVIFVVCAKGWLPDDASLVRLMNAAPNDTLPSLGPSCKIGAGLLDMHGG
jgi:hypothetical protein